MKPAWIIVCILCCLCLTIGVSLQLVIPAGTSMEPTFSEGDLVICIAPWFHDPAPGDVILIRHMDMILLKRIYAVEGQTVGPDLTGSDSIIVPDGWLFVLGDNLAESLDSRDQSFGLVNTDSILGYAIWNIPKSND